MNFLLEIVILEPSDYISLKGVSGMTKVEMEKVKEALMDSFHIGYEYALFKIQPN